MGKEGSGSSDRLANHLSQQALQPPEVHRLLDLVGEVIGDEDPGDVGLDQADCGGRLVIGRRLH